MRVGDEGLLDEHVMIYSEHPITFIKIHINYLQENESCHISFGTGHWKCDFGGLVLGMDAGSVDFEIFMISHCLPSAA